MSSIRLAVWGASLGVIVSCRHAPPTGQATATAASTSASQAPSAAPAPSGSAGVAAPPKANGVRSQADCPNDMIFIPAADYTVALPNVADPALKQTPQHVHVDAFCIDRTEMPMTSYPTAACGKQDNDCMLNATTRGPATCVSPAQAECACQKGTAGVVKRLPTDPEWVLAALGTDGRRYPWGNDPYPEGYKIGQNYCPHQDQMPVRDWLCPVEANVLDRSPQGVIGMCSNGLEITSTCARVSVAAGSQCLMRGGDLQYGPLAVPATVTNDNGPESNGPNVSFRCVVSER